MSERPIRRVTPLPAPGDPPQIETIPAPPPWAAEFLREIRALVDNTRLEIGHVNTRLTALEGGVRMLLAGDETTQRKLDRIEATTDAIEQHNVGLRVAQSDLRVRVERLEADGQEHANGAGPSE